MVRIKGERATLDHGSEMSDPSKGCKKLPIIWRPKLLMRLQLGAPKPQWFPAIRPPLLKYSPHGQLTGVCSEGEVCSCDGVVEEGCRGQGFLDCFEGFLAVGIPWKFLWFPLEALEQVEEVFSCVGDETPVVIYHS